MLCLSQSIIAQSNTELYNRIKKEVEAAEARARKDDSKANSAAEKRERELEIERAREVEARRQAEERRIEEARIKSAGDNYMRSSAGRYNSMRAEAEWQATTGRAIVAEKTSMENVINPGTRIIEDDSDMDLRPVNTRTDKSSFAEKLNRRKGKESEGISSDMGFKSINLRGNEYLKKVVQNNYRPSYYQYSGFVKMDTKARPLSFSQKLHQTKDYVDAWADRLRVKTANATLSAGISFCEDVAKSTISGISAMSEQLVRVYDIASNIGDVFSVEKSIMTSSFEFIKNNAFDPNAYKKIDVFLAEQEQRVKGTAESIIMSEINAPTVSGLLNESAASWFFAEIEE